MNMKAIAVLGPGQVKLVDDVPVPQPGDYEVLLKVLTCGFCNGTDMQIVNGTLGKNEGMGDYPTLLGHEGIGEVVAMGGKVRHIQMGDRFLHPNIRPDVGNGYTKTYGGMADYGLAADHQAMLEDGFTPKQLPYVNRFKLLPKSLDPVDGAAFLSMSEALSAVRNFGIAPGMDLLIYGAGPLGLGVAAYSRLLGAASITMVDGNDARLERADRAAHLDAGINRRTQDVDAALEGKSFDVAVDAAGSVDVLLNATRRLRPGGKLGSLGVLPKTANTISLTNLQNNTTLHMLNLPYAEYDVMDENLRYIAEGKIDPKDFYSHVLPREQILECIEMVRSKRAFKVILTIN
ncbi:MAG: zinc-binding dehydrogenase [Oscillospiraceae bacterium]